MKVFRLIFIPILAIGIIVCASFTAAARVFDRAVSAQEAVIPVTAPQVFEGCAGPEIGAINPDYEQDIVERTNQIRAEHDLPPLKRVEGLDLSARYHTADMSVNNFFDHNTIHKMSDGRAVQICDTWARIEKYYFNWSALAENIAAGQSVPEMAMDGWMNSPDHRHNILSDAYWEIGVGYYEGDGEYRYYWGQNFGRRSGQYPLIIEMEKARTTNPDVNVYIYGSWRQMRVRVNQGEWSDWMPFERSFDWQLPEAPGEYTLTAELRGPDGRATSADQIELVEGQLLYP